jgi:hypothetical protein
MQLTVKHDYGTCGDGPCAVWETSDPDLVGVQGMITEPPEPLPPHEQHERIVVVRRHMLEAYLKGDL